jgi:hypothetical protein
VRRTLTAALTAAALLLTASPFAVADDAGDGASDPLSLADEAAATTPAAPTATQTLDAVVAVFRGQGASARAQRLAAGRDMTLMMRDLRRGLDDLTPADRITAEGLLSRPTVAPSPFWLDEPQYDPASVLAVPDCTDPNLCVTYAQSGPDAPANPSAWATTTRNVAHNVWNRVVTQGGYRAPRDDSASANHGPNGKLDIYVMDLPTGLYGYCTTDDPTATNRRDTTSFAVSAYCVVDNDYAGFPVNTPLENLKVTVAHEFFHAVQYAYDWWEDVWLLEGTAAWVEDEIYDAVNDNRQYLAQSPLRNPGRSMDYYSFVPPYYGPYGNWIWWRYLGERYPREGGTGLPLVLRDVIANIGGSTPASPGRYSTQALARALASRGGSVPAAFTRFAVTNRAPARFYEEGHAYSAAPAARRYTLRDRTERAVSGQQRHLTSQTVAVKPGAGLRRGWKLRVRVDLPARKYGYRAAVTTYWTNGTTSTTYLAVDAQGRRTKVFGFNHDKVKRVDVTLVNASTRYACWQGKVYACEGTPRDDNRTTRAWFKAVK